MDGWLLVTAIIVSIVTLSALFAWSVELVPVNLPSNEVDLRKEFQSRKSDAVGIFFVATFIGTLIAFIWSGVDGYRWNVIVVFVWIYAVGYAWGRVELKIALERSSRNSVIFSCLLTTLAMIALFLVIDIAQPLPSIFSFALTTFNTGATHWVINGYMLLGVSGLILVVVLPLMLVLETNHDYNIVLGELQRKIEEEERRDKEAKSDEVLRTEIKQLLDQGKKVSKQYFPDVNENRVRNAMAAIVLAFPSTALEYNASETTLRYLNDEGVHRLHDLCDRATELTRVIGAVSTKYKHVAKELTQVFLKELGLPDVASETGVQTHYRDFPVVLARTRGLIRGLPADFPVFVPLLREQQMREDDIDEIFRKLFRVETLACNSGFGLVLSPINSPYLHNALTQRDEDGVKENIAYLDEEDMRDIITTKNFEPRNVFLIKVAQQVSFTLISPFHTRGVTPGAAFVGRDREMSDIIRNIGSRSYVVLGARRIGKTSLILQVMGQLQRRNYRVFYLDGQSVETYHDFFRNIRAQWADQLGACTFVNDLPITFQETVTYLSRFDPSHRPLVFIFDEIDRLLKFDMSQDNPEPLFRTFRALSQQKMCQFIFSGERRINHQLHDTGSPLFNFPVPIRLGVLSLDDAQKLIEEPLSQFGISLEDGRLLTSTIVDACSRHPNLLQEMGHRIFEHIDQQVGTFNSVITKEIVSQVINHPDFRKLYQEIFWGQSSALEKAITLLAPPEGSIELATLARQLKQHGFNFSQKQFDVALDFLILYCIFQEDVAGLKWVATHFREAVDKTVFDQEEYLAELCQEFSVSKDNG